MSEHVVTVTWARGAEPFLDKRYHRTHEWRFDGGAVVPASASPHVVKVPLSDPSAVDPEEAFLAGLSYCHMLSFLWLAATRGFLVDDYRDDAVATLGKNEAGRMAILKAVLRPRIVFSGDKRPSDAELAALHHDAHDLCFLANSVRTEISVEPPRA
jgi:organic hydroperoxide reductase OsmC/OhrA